VAADQQVTCAWEFGKRAFRGSLPNLPRYPYPGAIESFSLGKETPDSSTNITHSFLFVFENSW
jgi:hypothetical protein